MRKLLLLLGLLFSVVLSQGQTTNVTATVQYPDGNTFANGTVLAVFTPPNGQIDQVQYKINGNSFPYYVTGTMDGTGTFNLSLTDDHLVRPFGGRWSFTVCSVASISCSISIQDVFGTSINLTTQINASITNPFSNGQTFPVLFADSELSPSPKGGTIYFNYISKTFRCWNGSSWIDCLSNGGVNNNPGTVGAAGYYATTGNIISPDKCTYDGNGNETCNSLTTTGVLNFSNVTTPANPASGKVSLYSNLSTGLLTCLNSNGSPCFGTANVLNASACSGADLGTQINNCDAVLGSSPGTIWVTKNGTISTAVVLCSNGNNHTLYVMGGVTITESPVLNTPLSIAVGSSGCRITGDGPTSIIYNANTIYNGATFNGDLITVGSKVSGWNATVNTTLTADTTVAQTVIPVTSSTGCVSGYDVLIKENGPNGPYRYAEFNIIASIPDGTHITLLTGTEHAYRTVLQGNTTSVACFAPGALTKNWEVSNIHLEGNLTGMSATGPNSGVAAYVCIDGLMTNNWVDGVGGRGLLAGSSGYPSSRITISNNHVHDVGLVPSGNGTPGIESYSETSHNMITGNTITRTGSHGIAIHGTNNIVSNNIITWAAIGNNGYAGISSDTAGETILITNNTISRSAGPGIILFGSSIANSTEVNHATISNNTIIAAGGDCIDVGTLGSPGMVKAMLVTGNQCINPAGANGILLEGNAGGYIANTISNNHIEGATNCINLGQINLGPTIEGNETSGCGTALNLNSIISGTVIGNHDDGTSTTGIALGTADFTTFIANHGFGTITGTFGVNSTVIGQRGYTNQLPNASQTFNVQNPIQTTLINAADGTVLFDLTYTPTTAGFNTNGTVTSNHGGTAMLVTIGNGVADSTGTIQQFVAAPHGWNCIAQNRTRADLILQSSSTTTTATFTNYGTTFAATNWTTGDIIQIHCVAE